MSQPKKHHFVPQSLLRQFSNDGKRIHVFDKKTGRIFESAILDAGSERHFNRIEIDGRQINLEEQFNGIDGRLAEVVQMLERARQISRLDPQERYDIAFLAAVQLLRVNLQRTTLMSFPAQVAEAFAGLGIPNVSGHVGTIDTNKAKIISLEMLVDSPRFARAIAAKNWSLHLTPAGSPFWISDCPIVMANAFDHGGMGLEAPGIEVFWPISQSVLLQFSCPTVANHIELTNPAQARLRRSNPTFDCAPQHVRFFNSLQVLQSGRFVYGPTRDFSLGEQVLATNPDRRHVLTNTTMSKMGQVPRNNRIPPGKWLVVYGRRTSHRCPVRSWADVDGELHVCVTIDGWEILQQVLRDAPYSEIGIFCDGSHSRHMREVLIEPMAGKTTTVRIVHADSGAATIMRGFQQRRTASSAK